MTKKVIPKKSNSRKANRTLRATIYVAVLVLLPVVFCVAACYWFRLPVDVFAAGMIALICSTFFYILLVGIADNRRVKQRNKARIFAEMKLRQAQRSRASVEAQLNKPKFEDRLENFMGSQTTISPNQILESTKAKSRASFWQAENLIPESTPARPIEFFRMLLHRISKLVSLSK